MADGGDIKLKVSAETGDAEKSLSSLQGKAASGMDKVAQGASKAAADIAHIATAAKAAGDVIASFGRAITAVGIEWESAFAKVQTIMDTTQLSAEAMKAQILDLSNVSGISAAELSGSVYDAISATGDTANAVQLVGTASKLATAGFADTASSLSVLTTAINAYGLETSEALKISDSLIQTQNLGVTTVADLAAGMGKAIASASAYGVDLSNVEATYIAMTKSGISTAESTTYMSSMFKELGSSSTKLGALLKEQTGQSFDQLMAQGKSLSDVLGVLYEAVGKDSTALMNMWGSAEAGKAANAIINQGLETFNQNLESLRDSSGTTEAAYATMCNTVEHQTQALQNTIKNLGTAMYEDLQPDLSGLIADANSWATEIADAYSKGGIDGASKAAAKILPRITQVIMNLSKSALSGVAKILPDVLGNLLGSLPDVLADIVDFAPAFIDGIVNGLSSAIPQIVSILPRLITGLPKLAEGLWNALGAAFQGSGTVVNAIVKSIGDALKDAGVAELNFGDVVERMLNQANTDFHVPDVTLNDFSVLGGEVDVSVVQENIATAMATIQDTIKGLGLSEEAEKQLTDAVMKGSGAEALTVALTTLNVPKEKAEEAAKKIEDALTTINNAISTIPDLSDDQRAKIADYVKQGGSLTEALETIGGLDPETAKAKAKEIQPAITEIQNTLKSLNIDVDVSALKAACVAANGDIVAALTLLGLSDAEISGCIASMATLADSISTQLSTIFSSLKDGFTDGKDNDTEVSAEAKTALDELATDTMSRIDAWEAEALTSLQQMGLTADELATQTETVKTQAETMRAELNGIVTGVQTWITDNADAATSVVESHFSQLDALLTNAEQLEARLAALEGSINSKDYSTRTAVESGLVSDEGLGASAVELTYKEREAAILKATEEYQSTVDEATGKYDEATSKYYKKLAEADKQYAQDGDRDAWSESVSAAHDELVKAGEELAAATTEAGDKLAAAEEEANTKYSEHMQKIIEGMIGSDADLAGALEGAAEKYNAADLAKTLMDKIFEESNSEGGTYDLSVEDLLKGLNFTDSDVDSIAAALGVSSEDLLDRIRQALLTDDPANFLTQVFDGADLSLAGLADSLDGILADALEGLDLSEVNVAQVLAMALQEGWLVGVEGIDWSNPEAVLKAAIEAFIQNANKGPFDPVTPDLPVEPNPVPGDGPDETVEEVAEEMLGDEESELPAKDVEQPVNTTYTKGETTDEAGVTDGSVADEVPEQTETKDVIVPVNADTETTLSPDSDPAGEAQEAVENAMADGTVLVIEQTANVNLNVTAEITGTDFSQAGAKAAEQFAQGISSGTGKATQAAASMNGQALAALSTGSRSAKAIGEDFGQGYAQGIKNKESTVYQTAVNLAKQALQGVKDATKTASPSKKARELGDYFGQGYGIGIAESMAKAANTARNAVGNILSAVAISPSGFGTLRVEAGSEPLQVAMEGADAPVYLDGRQIASIQGGHNQSRLEFLSNRANRGMGR